MPDWLEGVPLGFVLLLGPVVMGLKRWLGRGAAKRGYPQLASKLGLEHELAPGQKVGRLRGYLDGFAVRAEPEDGAKLQVVLHGPLRVDLRNYEVWKRPRPGYESFWFGERLLDDWLKSRHCRPELVEPLAGDVELRAILHAMRGEPRLRELSVTGERIVCAFDFGTPSYIPPRTVELMLPRLTALARRLEVLASQAVG